MSDRSVAVQSFKFSCGDRAFLSRAGSTCDWSAERSAVMSCATNWPKNGQPAASVPRDASSSSASPQFAEPSGSPEGVQERFVCREPGRSGNSRAYELDVTVVSASRARAVRAVCVLHLTTRRVSRQSCRRRRDHLTGNERAWSDASRGRVGDVVRFADTANGRPPSARLVLRCTGKAIEHGGVRRPGATALTRTPAGAASRAADFVRPSTAVCWQRRRWHWPRFMAVRGRDIDDAAALLPCHDSQLVLQTQQGSEHVGVKRGGVGLRRLVDNATGLAFCSCTVDRHVKSAESADDPIDQLATFSSSRTSAAKKTASAPSCCNSCSSTWPSARRRPDTATRAPALANAKAVHDQSRSGRR